MKITEDGVTATPKILSWFGLPSHIGERERFEFLKRDIYIHEARFDELPGLWAINGRYTGFAFNLDRILEYLPFPRLAGVMVLAKKLIRYISGFCPHNCLVHTRILNEDLKELFAEAGIPFYQQNLEYRPNAWLLIRKKLLPVIAADDRPIRKFVRVSFPAYFDYRVTIRVEKNHREIPVTGKLKDLSLNGLGARLNESRSLRQLQLRDHVKVFVRNAQNSIQIANAFVTRRDEATREVGLNFNIADESFIARPDAVCLSRAVYNGLSLATNKKIKVGLNRALEII
ncbi:MAG: PilZ domain-containing protein [Leptospiraceae bacterium]|nr:PilZ domain-containing protein [Leptospiraceae bacterium]MCB1200586.1 PilZ domain-containing protein [Leptospiraceae bacterium]